MDPRSERPLIVQSDRSLLLEVGGPAYAACRDAVAPFAELVKSPEYVHTYRISPLSVWNAAASGMDADEMVDVLQRFSRFDLPSNVVRDIRDLHGRYGRLRLVKAPEGQEGLRLEADDEVLLDQVLASPLTRDYVSAVEASDAAPDGAGNGATIPRSLAVTTGHRGELKRSLVRLGWPVDDLAGYVDGAPLAIRLADELPGGRPFGLRGYQHEAVERFHRDGSLSGGSGVVVLPCGAGKTVVGLGAMSRVGRRTLVLTTSHTAVRQWHRELVEKTNLTEEDVGEYTGEVKEIRPVTISTYQMLTWRKRKTDEFPHLDLLCQGDWGLIVYDEVHLLPAPVFRMTADIQATRRLGLTATLVREDGHEEDVFSLIGPKRYELPWKVLEREGWIAEARCVEVRLALEPEDRKRYALVDRRAQFRIAAENPRKHEALERLLSRYVGERVLIIGQYLDQLQKVARQLDVPLITGRTPREERIERYAAFASGEAPVLVVSKVGNFAIDLPEARVIVQISGTFGSRQEEAQRLGRVLRPKADGGGAWFYTLVSEETLEQDFAQHRQLFLTEQGYAYQILGDEELVEHAATAPQEAARR
ncbi:MAG: DEAD/DEAH box helicase [Planctomycetes bacterium]|nr:DEAD/DEAH box helicase [Planctomycetota bacterium]